MDVFTAACHGGAEWCGHEQVTIGVVPSNPFQNAPDLANLAFVHFTGNDFYYLFRQQQDSQGNTDDPNVANAYGHLCPVSVGSTVGIYIALNKGSLRHIRAVAASTVNCFITYLMAA